MHSIGVTGATGFIGDSLCNSLRLQPDVSLRRFVRHPPIQPEDVEVEAIGPSTQWGSSLRGLDALVHCAAHVHKMGGDESLASYRSINTEGTLTLAKAAAHAGVKRFIFVSSVKVMGEASPASHPFRISDVPQPIDPYGVSKWEAEQGLWDFSRQTEMQMVVVRPPLVYGPGVRANFHQLMKWIAKGIPMPFCGIHNKRSLVSLPNLVSLIETCVHHPRAPGNSFFASDGQDLSTGELIKALALAMGRPSRCFPVPASLLNLSASLMGRKDTMARLTQSLQVDIVHTRDTLNWAPVTSMEQGMALTVADFLKNEASI